MTEAEIAALDDDAPASSSNVPPMTTAPSDAPIEQVEAGMRESEAIEQQQRERSQYAGEASSAQELRREGREKAMLEHAMRARGTDLK